MRAVNVRICAHLCYDGGWPLLERKLAIGVPGIKRFVLSSHITWDHDFPLRKSSPPQLVMTQALNISRGLMQSQPPTARETCQFAFSSHRRVQLQFLSAYYRDQMASTI